ncbi:MULTISPECIES: glycoside hydrolase family 3 N-terminal domain-containing protein [unclassified Microbacterium]|uniref:glycoside hydrolase family 3 N-terminal domain-containing protein n=1 Tax=unclassified Microbacterium TaxID=2609290 RepID=UPI00214ACAC9|nr:MULTISPECIES: glycoside hydrolase family 3 N-terminal domain-containing protein [unclassified Microbacterium]MCR2809520.1 glycoside hydrolase family 3 protein [Microbacterium sp. zg.B185]WIM20654.1 glycoside hydrolase family 3 N-terminal domain-containing protein [Microbacterium sp. zg-B185]
MNSARSTLVAGVLSALLVLGLAPPSHGTDRPATEPSPSAAEHGTVRVIAGSDQVARARELVAAMTTRERAASVVMGHIPSTDATALADYMARTGIGGFILMGANIPASETELRQLTAALTTDAALPPLIAVDQEGGDVSRLPWDGFGSAVTLKDQPAEAAGGAFAARSALLQRAGIGVNFGIVADVTDDRSMFIFRRALGTTPEESAARVDAAVAGSSGQAMSTLKHFPGHGAAPGDSHSGIPTSGRTKDEWTATDGVPFRTGIDAGADILMFGHLSYPAIDAAPATLSAEWHRIAREELGFTGLAITDDLGMLQASGLDGYQDPVANAVAALAAGNDMVLSVMFSSVETAPRIVEGIAAAADSGILSPDRLEEAALRVTTARLQVAAAGRGLVPCGECAPVE